MRPVYLFIFLFLYLILSFLPLREGPRLPWPPTLDTSLTRGNLFCSCFCPNFSPYLRLAHLCHPTHSALPLSLPCTHLLPCPFPTESCPVLAQPRSRQSVQTLPRPHPTLSKPRLSPPYDVLVLPARLGPTLPLPTQSKVQPSPAQPSPAQRPAPCTVDSR